ncbi:hypothetical protein CEXT_506051 [Caerostris extrusa]|uniref:Uncharacterized protein n=1 Tax=Caerostris extrusa TaxID=172846 RepID=A0AAV4XCJ0_CAEEX|nr:hypothetical protein CEXT_506051 [Caerostris extrusa]
MKICTVIQINNNRIFLLHQVVEPFACKEGSFPDTGDSLNNSKPGFRGKRYQVRWRGGGAEAAVDTWPAPVVPHGAVFGFSPPFQSRCCYRLFTSENVTCVETFFLPINMGFLPVIFGKIRGKHSFSLWLRSPAGLTLQWHARRPSTLGVNGLAGWLATSCLSRLRWTRSTAGRGKANSCSCSGACPSVVGQAGQEMQTNIFSGTQTEVCCWRTCHLCDVALAAAEENTDVATTHCIGVMDTRNERTEVKENANRSRVVETRRIASEGLHIVLPSDGVQILRLVELGSIDSMQSKLHFLFKNGGLADFATTLE